ncbi:MAG TPA: NnrU family protein [Rhodospirillaceae bacterium]|nr:NnrU family protein [Rhodospirillaceae bacterium]
MNGFEELAAALAIFLATHSLPALPGWRARLVAAVGERRYLIGHSVVGSVTLLWLVAAALAAPYVELWTPPDWARWVPLTVMPLAMMLLVAGLTTANPYSLGRGRQGFDPAHPGIVAVTRHPVLWAAALWAAAHLAANGSLRAVVLFGMLGGFSVMGTRLFERRRGISPDTSNLPFRAILEGRATLELSAGLLWRCLLGLALYVLLLALHGPVIGRYPLIL